MSYCRFSSANWKSDVYVYDGSDGIVIHIATTRREGYIPKVPSIHQIGALEFEKALANQRKYLSKCMLVPIDHPLAGKTVICRTAKEAIDELTFLQYEGFSVPKFVIDQLREYVKENEHE